MSNERKSPRRFKLIIVLVIIILIGIAGAGVYYYTKYFGPNVTDKQEYLYIHTGATYNDVLKTVTDESIVKDPESFDWAAHHMHYINRVKPGRYHLHDGMNNRRLINMLASGTQDPVTLSFHNLRLKEDFAGFVSKKIEPDSTSIIHMLDSTGFVSKYGFTPDNVYAMFIPNTYQLYWNTTPDKFFKRMYANYEKFWTPEKKQQAAAINLSPIQVSVLASLVDAEALHDDEMPTIAGLYLNRLKKGIKLESDPTVIFALHDFTIHRVLKRYLSYNSPYNTYLNFGLPPGPIMMPSVNALNSVLNYQKNDYLFMCAKADFSGYHAFATNQADHLVNAHKYQKALDERNIKKVMFEYTTKVRVRYGETDQMGYMYYGNYAEFYEVGRVEMLRSLGMTYSGMEESGIMMPVLEMHCKYIKPALYDEEISIKVIMNKMPGVKIYFNYELYNPKGELINIGDTLLVFVNMKTNRPCMPPDEFIDKLKPFLSRFELNEMATQLLRRFKLYRYFIECTKYITFPGFRPLSLYTVAVFFFEEFNQGTVTTKASSLAYNFMLALFPATIFVFTLIPFIPIRHFQDNLLSILNQVMPQDAYSAFHDTITEIVKKKSGGLSFLGFLTTLFFATNGVSRLMQAFNRSSLQQETRTYLHRRWVALVLTVVISISLLIAVAIMIAGHKILVFLQSHFASDAHAWFLIIALLRWVIVVVIFFVTVSLLYRYGPAHKQRWKFFNPGSVLATTLAVLTSLGFTYYINNFSSYNKVYGSIGTLIVIMIWLYLNSLIILIGFELNASIQLSKQSIKIVKPKFNSFRSHPPAETSGK